MAFRFEPGEPVAAEARRIVVGRLGAAIGHLGEPDVHEARKRLKEARALLRLVAPALGGGARAEVMALRDAARQLSAARDAEALVEAFEKIQAGIDPSLRRRVRRGLPEAGGIDGAPGVSALSASLRR